jgi:hypothetical protein
MIGDLAQAREKPYTELPSRKKNSGCVLVILLYTVVFGASPNRVVVV